MRRKWLRLLWHYGSLKLTPAGQVFLLLWFISAGQGAVEELLLPIYHLWAFVTMVLGVAWLFSKVSVPRLSLMRRPVHPVSAGEILLIMVEVENLSRRPVYALTLLEYDVPPGLRPLPHWEPEVLPRLGPGEKAVLTMRLRAVQRGAYTLRNLYGVSAFPLGLCRGWCRSPQATACLVYPAFTVPPSFPVPQSRHYQPGGFRMSSNVGEAAEFMHTREYRVGDNLRHMHWASWARLGKPIVKIYQEEYFVRLALVLDTRVKTGADMTAFESTISMAAGIAAALSRQEYLIDLVAVGATIHRLQAGRSLSQVTHVLDLLACLEPVSQVDWPAVTTTLLAEARHLTAVVALWMDWTPHHAAFVGQLQEGGVAVQSIIIRHGKTTLPLPVQPSELCIQLAPWEAAPVAAGPESMPLARPTP